MFLSGREQGRNFRRQSNRSGGKNPAEVRAEASAVVRVGLGIASPSMILIWNRAPARDGSRALPRLILKAVPQLQNAREGPVALQNLQIAIRVSPRSD